MPTTRRRCGRHGRGSFRRRCASPNSSSRACEAGSAHEGRDAERPELVAALRRRAVGVRPVRGGRGRYPARWRWPRSWRAAITALAQVAARAQPARRGDERGAGGAAAVAARSRDPPHRRHDLRADAQVRGGGGRLLATTSTCCRTRTRATRPTGRAPRSDSCARSASACRSTSDPGADDRLYTVDSGW